MFTATDKQKRSIQKKAIGGMKPIEIPNLTRDQKATITGILRESGVIGEYNTAYNNIHKTLRTYKWGFLLFTSQKVREATMTRINNLITEWGYTGSCEIANFGRGESCLLHITGVK